MIGFWGCSLELSVERSGMILSYCCCTCGLMRDAHPQPSLERLDIDQPIATIRYISLKSGFRHKPVLFLVQGFSEVDIWSEWKSSAHVNTIQARAHIQNPKP